MRAVSFRMLWLMWAGQCSYDAVASFAGWFSVRSPADRFNDDCVVAWFIMSAWILVLLIGKKSAPTAAEDAA